MLKEIIIETNQEGADYVSDAFFSIGASGVKIVDPNDINEVINSDIHWDYVEPSLLQNDDNTVYVSAFVSNQKCQEAIDMVLQELSFYKDIDLGSLRVSTKLYESDDWCQAWRKFFVPIEIDKLVVVPKWIDYDNKDNKILIKINPSMAFGTGEHESTKMMLMLMCQIQLKDKYVLDIGTGSGILGVAAIKLGAKKAYMCDIDSLAVKSAEETIALNSVAMATELQQNDLLSKKDLVGDVLLANLTADILLKLLDGIENHIKKGGSLLCSGIIHCRKEQVLSAYLQKGFKLIRHISMGEWDAFMFKRI